MKVILDAFGGDSAPLEVLRSCEVVVSQGRKVELCLVGNIKKIEELANKNAICIKNFEIIHAPDILTMHDEPSSITGANVKSSMAVGLSVLSKCRGDVFVTAGNSGALVVGATFSVGRINNVSRCAFSPILPGISSPFMLIDGGANISCRPSMLVQFAVMGSIYMKKVLGINSPRVALANIGTEEHKGDKLRTETFLALSEEDSLNFIGNIEARNIPYSTADVIVTDGFTGNIILKLYEGMAGFFMNKFKNIFNKNIKNKIAASFFMSDLKQLKKQIGEDEYGGAPVLGAAKPIFKVHGNSKAKNFANAINSAILYAKTGVIREISDFIAKKNKIIKRTESV
ncbi:MAG: phosphate acyltransferase PlsX [Oscillospiraceae bacterium]|nr:phosphate acyltransferase PlsX [Oscillospiraceae bacterium]